MAQTTWVEVAVVVDEGRAEVVADLLGPWAAGGVAHEQWGDPADLDPSAMLPDVMLKIYLPADQATLAVRRQIAALLRRFAPDLAPPIFQTLDERDWATAWKARYRPFRVGHHFVVRPSWLDDLSEVGWRPGDLLLVLDPGMAFGTGLHATTQLCLTFLEEVLQPGQRVLDVGTGSGILAIAAARLGAEQVLGLDNDQVAIEAARDNVLQNGVENCVAVRVGELDNTRGDGWDVVVVNILAPVVIELLAYGLLSYVVSGGWLLLSGIIDEQESEVATAIAAAGGIVRRVRRQGEWLAFAVQWASNEEP